MTESMTDEWDDGSDAQPLGCDCDGDGMRVICPDDMCRGGDGCGEYSDRSCYGACPCQEYETEENDGSERCESR